jgi:7-cyano-7-deazaguanine synthase
MTTKAIVLHSGGLDSSVALALAIRDFGAEHVKSLGVDYGQRHKVEMAYAAALCHRYGVERVGMSIDDMPKSMLTDPSIEIPKVSYADLPFGVSPSYVPFRNGQLLAKAAALASSLYTASSAPFITIYLGVHAEDAARDSYPDCTFHFIGAMAAAIEIGTYHQVRVNAPLISLFKHEIVELGSRLGVPFEFSFSCYAGGELHCAVCPTCRSRKTAFELAGVPDPTKYAE